MIPLDELIPELLLATGLALLVGNLLVLVRRRRRVERVDIDRAAAELRLSEAERVRLQERLERPQPLAVPAGLAIVGLVIALWGLGSLVTG